MRIMIVEPGPWFSTMDVARGWHAGLNTLGVETVSVNLGDRIGVYDGAHIKDPETGEWRRAFAKDAALLMASKSVVAAAMEFWPDVVVFISATFVPQNLFELFRGRRMTTVIVHTESPYEDERQVGKACWADLNLVNDPTNLEAFRAENPRSWYVPHAYNPAVHRPGPARPECVSDFVFVGTGYPSRCQFLEQVDWTGIDVALAGNWQLLAADSRLRKFVAHDIDLCCENTETVDLYRSTKVSANLYRREAQNPTLSDGWAMGPREVELAATGTFFLRDPRGESDEVLPMLPTFSGPEDFGEQLRWWLNHPDQAHTAATAARAAVADRTFESNARRLLELLGT